MSSYPPGAASDPYAPYNQDSEPDNSTLEQAFADFDGLGSLYRAVYKYTDCGPGIGALIRECVDTKVEEPLYNYDVEKQDWIQVGTTFKLGWKQVERWFYCDDLRKLGTWKDMQKAGQLVIALSVSSIVEGVDATTDTIVVQIDHEGDPKELAKHFYEAVGEVDRQAHSIWDETHGCSECARLILEEMGEDVSDWEGDDDPRWQVGETPVLVECPECGGAGMAF